MEEIYLNELIQGVGFLLNESRVVEYNYVVKDSKYG